MKTKHFCTTLLISALALGATQASANVVINGNFEDGDFTGWTTNNTSINDVDPIAGLYDAYIPNGKTTAASLLQTGFGITTPTVTSLLFTMPDPGGYASGDYERGLNLLYTSSGGTTDDRIYIRVVDVNDDGDGDVQLYDHVSTDWITVIADAVSFSESNSLSLTFNVYGNSTELDYDLNVNGNTATGLSYTQTPSGGDYTFDAFDGIYLTGGGSSVGYHVDNITVIPEPSTYALLAGIVLLGYARLRRRKS